MSEKTTRPPRQLPVRTGRANRTKAPRIAPLLHGAGIEETRATHDALTFPPYWENLLLDGIGLAAESQAMELRRCPQCGSTLSRLIPVALAEARLAAASDVVVRSREAMTSGKERAPQMPSGSEGCHGA